MTRHLIQNLREPWVPPSVQLKHSTQEKKCCLLVYAALLLPKVQGIGDEGVNVMLFLVNKEVYLQAVLPL